jgi:hypothetical protein
MRPRLFDQAGVARGVLQCERPLPSPNRTRKIADLRVRAGEGVEVVGALALLALADLLGDPQRLFAIAVLRIGIGGERIRVVVENAVFRGALIDTLLEQLQLAGAVVSLRGEVGERCSRARRSAKLRAAARPLLVRRA